MEHYDELFRHIDGNKEKYVGWACRLIEQPSVSAHGAGMVECANVVAELLDELGMRVDFFNVDGPGPVVLGTLNVEAHATLMFYNHYDVQPPDPLEKWTTPPFAPVVKDGKLYGRGSADNKGNIVARLAALDSILAVFGETPVNIKFLIEGGEEVGSPGLEKFVRNERDRLFADGCIWEYGYRNRKGMPIINLGVKGMLYLELEAIGTGREVHSSWGAVVENPAWRLVNALASMRSADGRVLVDGFYDDISYEGLELLDRISLEDFVGDRLVTEFKGDPLKALLLEPVCNINGIISGYVGPGSKTSLPTEARAKMDIRLVPRQDPEKMLERIKEHLRLKGFVDIAVKVLQSYPGARTSHRNFLPRLVSETAVDAYKTEPIVIPSSAGSGPMYVVTDILGIPCVSTGVGYYGSAPHGPDENIRLEDFVAGIKHMALVMLNFHCYMQVDHGGEKA